MALSILLLGSSLALASVPALGASPAPEPTFTPGQAWLDAALPTEAPAGTTVSIGALLWSPDQGDVVTSITPRFTIHPATGKAAAAIANGVPDWRGHYTAQLVVPRGGFGRFDIGIPVTFCDAAGACVHQDSLFDVAVGPPVDVKLPAIASGSLSLSATTVPVRTSIHIDAQVFPNISWPERLPLPSRLYVQVREQQGPIVLEAPADAGQFGDGSYAANVIVDKPGDYVAQLATVLGAGVGDLFGTALAPFTVTASAEAAPAPATARRGEAATEWWPVALGAFGLVVAALLFFRGAERARA